MIAHVGFAEWTEEPSYATPIRHRALPENGFTMTMAPPVFVAGMLAYGLSFLPIAASGVGSLRGFECAFFTLLIPFRVVSMQPRAVNSITEVIAMLFSGWINIAFLAAVMIRARSTSQRAFTILRTATLLMIPFCWIVFYYERLYPREGHFIWIIGMVLVLFSDRQPSLTFRHS